MQDNLNKLDILFRQKDADAEYDVSHITDHWSQMETVLNAKHRSFHFRYFKGTGFLKTIMILSILSYVGYIIFRNNHNPVPPGSMKTKQSIFAEPQPVTVEPDTVPEINNAKPFKRSKRLKSTKRVVTVRATNNNAAIHRKESTHSEKKSVGIVYKKEYVRTDSVKTSIRASSPMKRSKKSQIVAPAEHLKENRAKPARQDSVSLYDTLKPTISIPVLKFRSQ